MKRTMIGLAALALLAACGVDGAPTPPEPREKVQTGITITGNAEAGIVGGSTSIRYTR